MGRPALLESFDADDEQEPPPEPAGPSEDWLAGHAAGREEALAEAASAQDALSAQIAQAVADLQFGYAEARQHMGAALRPLFTTLMERLLPRLAQESLVPHLVALLQEAAARDMEAPVRLRVPSGQQAALSATLAGVSAPPLQVIADPDLPDGRVCIAHPGTEAETVLDPDTFVAAAQEVLAALLEDDSEMRLQNG